jgi:hypothetical protein
MQKIRFSAHTAHQTISLSSLFEHSQPTKHVRKSEESLYEVNMSEVRKSFSSHTGYQTHPTGIGTDQDAA